MQDLTKSRDLSAENRVREFYEQEGWTADAAGNSIDAQLWEDLRPCAADYVRDCRRRIQRFLPEKGGRILDAASGPIQYPEYLEYSAGFECRVCVDISQSALDQARAKLGDKGEYVRASILELPFVDNSFDAILSLHTIYHIDRDQQEAAVRQLLRVAKPGAAVVIIYANPDRLLARLKRGLSLGRRAGQDSSAPLYYHAHPLSWWRLFQDSAHVTLSPWRSLTAQDSRRLIRPNGFLGRSAFKFVFALESAFPGLATSWGAYPIVVLKKR